MKGKEKKKEQEVMKGIREYVSFIMQKEDRIKQEELAELYFIMHNIRTMFAAKKSRKMNQLLKGNIGYLLLIPAIVAGDENKRCHLINFYCEYGVLHELAWLYYQVYHEAIDDSLIKLFLNEIEKEDEKVYSKLTYHLYPVCSNEMKIRIITRIIPS